MALGDLVLPEGADPVLDWPRPDVEAIVGDVLDGLGVGTVTWAYTAAEGPDTLRGWVAAVSVQVDTRGNNRRTAYAKADAARRVICALPWTNTRGAVVARVNVIAGPFWLVDAEAGPRYVARYELVVHPGR